MTTEILIVLALVLANGVFAGAEIAVLATRKSRLQELARGGSARAKLVLRLRDRPERFLATVQIGITVVGATAAAFGGAAIAARIAPRVEELTGFPTQRAEEISLGLVVIAVSYCSLVLGELVPKSIALKYGDRYATLVAGPLLFLSHVARPLVWILTVTSNIILRPFGDRTTFTEARLSPEELRQILDEASKSGALDSRSGEIAARAIEFDELVAHDVMVPRDRIAAISHDATREDLAAAVLERRHSRMPVYEKDLDHIVGYIAADDVLSAVLAGEEFSVKSLVRKVPFVPDGKSASQVLQLLQRERTRLAMVVDEFGGIAGLVTLDDLVEELVGEIYSEHEKPEDLLRREADDTVIVKGYVPIRTLSRALQIDLPEGDYSTVAGLVLDVAGRIPSAGEKFRLPSGTVLEILDATPRLIRSVRIVLPKDPG